MSGRCRNKPARDGHGVLEAFGMTHSSPRRHVKTCLEFGTAGGMMSELDS